MIRLNDVIDAISICAGFDPIHTPKQSDTIQAAWLTHFEDYPSISREGLLNAIKSYYKTPNRPFPQPADISSIARAAARDAADRAPLQLSDSVPASPEHRAAMMARINEILAKQARKWSIPS